MSYSAELEKEVVPSEARIEVAVRELAGGKRFDRAQSYVHSPSGGRNVKTEEVKNA